MYLQIINQDLHNYGDCYLLYIKTENSLSIILLRNEDFFKIDENSCVAIFKQIAGIDNNLVWINCFSATNLINVNMYNISNIVIKKFDYIDKKRLINPLDIINFFDSNEKKYIYHLEHQIIFEEYFSKNIYRMIDIICCKITSKCFHKLINNSFCQYLRKLTDHYYDSPNSKKNISDFIEEFNIDTNIISENETTDWKNFNDFSARNIDLKYRPIENDEAGSILFPSDGRVICFSLNKKIIEYIKSPKFNFYRIITLLDDQTQEKLYYGSGLICRLALHDYHHFHSPFSGKIISIEILGNPTKKLSECCGILDQKLKIMLHIKSNDDKLECYYLLFGTIMSDAIKFNSDKLTRVYQYMNDTNIKKHQLCSPLEILAGEDLGTFRYGSSHIALLFNTRIHFRKEIMNYSLYDGKNEAIESFCHARSYLGSISHFIKKN